MTENHERAEQARFVFHIYGCNVQIVPNATHAIRRFGTPRVTGAAVGKS